MTKPGSRNWRAETLIAIRTGGKPAASHAASWRHPSCSAHSPSGTIRPDCSATGMNCAGDIGPRPGCFHRISASSPAIAPGGDLDLGLVVQLELALAERRAHGALELDALGDLARHCGCVVLEAAAAGCLDALHGRVGVAQQELEILAVPGVRADAGTEGEVQLLAVERERRGRNLLELLGERGDLARLFQVGRQYREAIGAEARRGVSLPHHRAPAALPPA